MAHTLSPAEPVVHCDCSLCRRLRMLLEMEHGAYAIMGFVHPDVQDVVMDISCDAMERIVRAYPGPEVG